MTRIQAKRLDGKSWINMWRDFPCCCKMSWVFWPPERNNDRTLCNFIAEEHPRVSQKDVKTGRWGTHHLELATLSLQVLFFFLLCHALFQQDPFFGVCQEAQKSLNCGVWSISVSSVCRLRSPSHVLNANQILFQSVLPALRRDACHHRVCMPDVCWQFYPFHVPASAGCGIKSILYTKDTDREKGSDLCESIHKVCSKVGKKIPPWLFTLASRGALQEWAATCSSAQELSSTLKLVWRIYFGLDLLSPREMYSCWQLECTWCTSFGWIQSNHPRVQFASSEITHDMSLQVYFFTYQINS